MAATGARRAPHISSAAGVRRLPPALDTVLHLCQDGCMIPKEDSVSESAGWDAYFARVRTLKWDEVESEELEYKRDTERYLRSVTNEVLSSN